MPIERDDAIKAAAAGLHCTVKTLRARVAAYARQLEAAPRFDPLADADWLHELNAKHFVTTKGGKTFVCRQDYDYELKRPCLRWWRTSEFEELYRNRRVVVGHHKRTGEAIHRKIGAAWLDHPQRREYLGGVALAPEGGLPADVYNLWQGFKYEPAQGDWSLLREHVRENICSGNAEHFKYVLGWLATVVQQAGKAAGTVLVLRGEKGTGKGVFASALVELFGQHGLAVSNARHFTGNFNEHLRTTLLLFADEAFFAGDKTAEGVLKALTTEAYRMSEAKGIDAEQIANRLSIAMAANADWVVPASHDERRFAVFEVDSGHRQDHTYFGCILAQLQAGGYAAMLHDLLHYDLTGFNIRAIPQTPALVEQKIATADSVETWLNRALSFSVFAKYGDAGLSHYLGEEPLRIPREELYSRYEEYCHRMGNKYPKTSAAFGKRLKRMLGATLTSIQGTDGRDYVLAPLAELREAYAAYLQTTAEVLFPEG